MKCGKTIKNIALLKGIFIFIFLLVLLLPFVFSEVVVFSDYKTDTYVEKEKLHINRALILQNVGSNPIIPGELHFKLHEVKDDSRIASYVSNFEAKNGYDVELSTRLIEGNEETDLVVSVWEPVLPQFTYSIYLSYDLDFKANGVLFYEIKVPVEETTIPIKNNVHNLFIDEGYKVTYAPSSTVSKELKDGVDYTKVSWQNKENMVIEYSKIPFPLMGFKSVNIFWGFVIFVLMLLTYAIHRKINKWINI